MLIPQANVRHLMLRQDVIESVKKGQFQYLSSRNHRSGYRTAHRDEGRRSGSIGEIPGRQCQRQNPCESRRSGREAAELPAPQSFRQRGLIWRHQRVRSNRFWLPWMGSPSSMSALENGVELAVRLNAQLVGLFVEDINLLRATQLPFTREVSFVVPEFRRLDMLQLERQLRAQAGRVRQIMERITRGEKGVGTVPCHPGIVADEILRAGNDAELLMLGKTGRSCRVLADPVPSSVMLWSGGWA